MMMNLCLVSDELVMMCNGAGFKRKLEMQENAKRKFAPPSVDPPQMIPRPCKSIRSQERDREVARGAYVHASWLLHLLQRRCRR